MCGIAGVLNLNDQQAVPGGILGAMSVALNHRGPDAHGIFREGQIGLVHRRLSIIDRSERGNQPFLSSDGRFVMVYNGEIYNFRELRKFLQHKGYKFRTETDTEVLLYLYVEEGEECLKRLNGMFSFAVWDKLEKRLFAARDRVGVKPFYYHADSTSFIFGSEQKAIFASGIDPVIQEEKMNELMLFRYIAGEDTLFRNVKRLLPGHSLTVHNRRIQISRWWHLGERAQAHEIIKDPYEWFEGTFNSSIKYRMISDVPVGILLSGGLDSSTVAASVSRQGYKNISSFTVTFDEKAYNEGPLAKEIAKSFGLNYHELKISRQDLLNALRETSWLHDEPLAHQNDAHLYAISKYAKPIVSVLLSGEGSDELMGGYVRYRPLNYSFLRMAKPLVSLISTVAGSNRIKKLNNFLGLTASQRVLFNACNLYPKEFSEHSFELDDEFSYRHRVLEEGQKYYPGSPLRQAMYLDQHTFMSSLLDRNDRTTMGASIECRVPFLDYRLIEGIATLPDHVLTNGIKGKQLLYNTIGKQLPQSVRAFKKWGFGIPWAEYLLKHEEFKHELEGIDKNPLFQQGIFRFVDIKSIVKSFRRGYFTSEILIRQLLMIHIWHQNYFKRIDEIKALPSSIIIARE